MEGNLNAVYLGHTFALHLDKVLVQPPWMPLETEDSLHRLSRGCIRKFSSYKIQICLLGSDFSGPHPILSQSSSKAKYRDSHTLTAFPQ